MRKILTVAIACLSIQLTACGLTVPALDHHGDNVEANALFVQTVTTHVHCELRRAVFFTVDKLSERQDVSWLKDWAAKITLTINVDEKTAFSPGLTLTRFLPSFRRILSNGEVVSGSRAFDLGLGGSLSSTAAREQEITWFLVFKDLFEERKFAQAECEGKDRPFIEGDLKVKESLFSGVFPASLVRNISDPFETGGRLQVVQHQVSFLIEASGNVTPTWRFVDVSANTGGPLLGFTRNRKDTLLITMGPTQLSDAGRKLRTVRSVPSGPVESSHLAKQVGNSVGASLLGLR